MGFSMNWLALFVGLLTAQQLALIGDLIDELARLSAEGIKLGKLEHPYNKINKDLCKALKTDDYEQNAQLATSWYEEVRGQKMFMLRQRKLRAWALELISELERQRQAGTWCQGERIEALGRANKQEVMKHVAALRKATPKGMLLCNRVFEIFFMQTLKHLESCAQVYATNLRQTVEELNEFRLKDGDRALEPLIGALQKRLDRPAEADFELVQALRQQLAGDELDAALIRLTVESMKRFVRLAHVDQLEPHQLEEYVFDQLDAFVHQSCFYLTSNLRATLGPATLDLENLDQFWQGGKQLPAVAAQMRSYDPDVLKMWAKYLVCDKLLQLDYVQMGQTLKEKMLEQFN